MICFCFFLTVTIPGFPFGKNCFTTLNHGHRWFFEVTIHLPPSYQLHIYCLGTDNQLHSVLYSNSLAFQQAAFQEDQLQACLLRFEP